MTAVARDWVRTRGKRWQVLLARKRVELDLWPTDVRELHNEQTGEFSLHIYFPPHHPVIVSGSINPILQPTVELVWEAYGFTFPPMCDPATNSVGTGIAPPLV